MEAQKREEADLRELRAELAERLTEQQSLTEDLEESRAELRLQRDAFLGHRRTMELQAEELWMLRRAKDEHIQRQKSEQQDAQRAWLASLLSRTELEQAKTMEARRNAEALRVQLRLAESHFEGAHATLDEDLKLLQQETEWLQGEESRLMRLFVPPEAAIPAGSGSLAFTDVSLSASTLPGRDVSLIGGLSRASTAATGITQGFVRKESHLFDVEQKLFDMQEPPG